MVEIETSKYHVFISYARTDGSLFAEKLESELLAAGYKVWRDKRNLNPNQDFTSEIERAIERSKHVVVCITADTKRRNSFVRREIGYSIALRKPIVPLMVDNTIPPISIVNVTNIDFRKAWEEAVVELLNRLQYVDSEDWDGQVDHYKGYLRALYSDIIDFLDQTVITSLDLSALQTNNAVGGTSQFNMIQQLFIGHGIKQATDALHLFDNVRNAFDHYDNRMLLLGEPGSGKTTTLLTFARDAIAARLNDPSQPLPLLGFISSWDTENSSSIAEWLASGYSQLESKDVQRFLDQGKALLLLDGLDEIPSDTLENKKNHSLFMAAIPSNNRVLVTCRVEDYSKIGEKISLNGAVTLQSLNDTQMRAYLSRAPELLNAIQLDDKLKAVLSTPLIISMFTRMYQDMSESERQELNNLSNNPSELRDMIIKQYVYKSYNWERLHSQRKRENLPFTLDQVVDHLGRLAMENAGSYRKEKKDGFEDYQSGSYIEDNVLIYQDFVLVFGEEESRVLPFINLLMRMHVLIKRPNSNYGFSHLLVRDAMAYTYAKKYLYDTSLYSSLEEVANPAEALARTGHSRAVEPLARILLDGEQPWKVRSCAANALGFTRDVQAVDYLLKKVEDEGWDIRTAQALGRLRDERAFVPLVDLLETGSKYKRRAAAVGLGLFGDSRAIKPLIRLIYRLEDEDDAFTIEEAVLALSRLGIEGVDAVVAIVIDELPKYGSFILYSGARILMAQRDDRVVGILIDALASNNPIIRYNAARVLGLLRVREAIKPLRKLVSDNEKVGFYGVCVRDAAVKALDSIGQTQSS